MAVGDTLAFVSILILTVLLLVMLIPVSLVLWQVFLNKPVTGANWLPMMIFAFYIIFVILAIITAVAVGTYRRGNREMVKKY